MNERPIRGDGSGLEGEFKPLSRSESEKRRTAPCPKCEVDITIAVGTMANELVNCKDCGAELEVLNLYPLEFGDAPEDEEDWGE